MVHISHLRDKIEEDPKNPCKIKTIRGIGYRFEKFNLGKTDIRYQIYYLGIILRYFYLLLL